VQLTASDGQVLPLILADYAASPARDMTPRFKTRSPLVITKIASEYGERVSSVSTVSFYGLGGLGSIPDRGRGFFLYPLSPDRLWGPTQPPRKLILSQRVGRSRGMMLTSHPFFSPEVKKV
jgi:hypothetical protein